MDKKPFYRSRLWWPFLIMAIIVTGGAVYTLITKGTLPGLYEAGLIAALWGSIIWRVITEEPLEGVIVTVRKILGSDQPPSGPVRPA